MNARRSLYAGGVFLTLGALALVNLAGCGDEGNDLQTAHGALGTFIAWQHITNGAFRPGNPALATGGPGAVFYGWGTDPPTGSVWFNASPLHNNWTELLGASIAFAGPPAAAEFDVYGNNQLLVDAVAEADANGTFYVRISQGGGAGMPDWTAIPNAVFLGQPALATSMSWAASGPKSTLFLAGRGTDNRIWVAENSLVNGIYSANGWSGFSPIPGGTFPAAPAITWSCPRSASDPIVTAAAVGFDGQIYTSRLIGLSWTAWTPIPNGSFPAKPAGIVTSCNSVKKNTVVFALGMDSRIWFSQDHGTGTFDAGFSPIGSQTFTDGPGAFATRATTNSATAVIVAARASDQTLFFTDADAGP